MSMGELGLRAVRGSAPSVYMYLRDADSMVFMQAPLVRFFRVRKRRKNTRMPFFADSCRVGVA